MNTEVIAYRMQLHVGQTDEYRRRHAVIWPDLVAGLRRAGVLDYRIFLDPQSLALFAVLTRRCDHTLADLRDSEVMRRWWAMMADIMDTHVDASPIEVALEPVFVLASA